MGYCPGGQRPSALADGASTKKRINSKDSIEAYAATSCFALNLFAARITITLTLSRLIANPHPAWIMLGRGVRRTGEHLCWSTNFISAFTSLARRRLIRRVVATRRLPIRARRLRHRAATYLRICHEAAQGALEEHGRHWGRSQNQGRQDQSHAALLHRLTGHTVTGRAHERELVHKRCHPERGRHADHHVQRDRDHRRQYRHGETWFQYRRTAIAGTAAWSGRTEGTE